MSTEETMTIDERYKYFRMMKKRYERANKQEKGQILDEMQVFTGQHRKGLIRRLNGSLARQPRANQRGSSYGPAVDDALRVISKLNQSITVAPGPRESHGRAGFPTCRCIVRGEGGGLGKPPY